MTSPFEAFARLQRLSRAFPASVRRSLLAATIAAVGTALVRLVTPHFEIGILAQGAARLAAMFTGSRVVADAAGWALPNARTPVIITTACAAADYFCLVAMLLAWQLTRHGRSPLRAACFGVAAALPVAVFVNSLRIVALVHVHRSVTPHFPPAYDAFLHLVTGVAILLPSLIGLNLVLEFYARRHPVIAS